MTDEEIDAYLDAPLPITGADRQFISWFQAMMADWEVSRQQVEESKLAACLRQFLEEG